MSKILFIYLTYNRPNVLQACLASSLGNALIPPTECWIIDDGSEPNMQLSLVKFCIDNRGKIPIDLILKQRNEGIGWNFEYAYNLAKMKSFDYVCMIEGDYIWRKGWLEDCLAVFEANPYVVAIPGTDHVDMYRRDKTHDLFPKLMMEQFPRDISNREHMYIPFDIQTNRGNMKVFGASNSCGCAIYAWNRFFDMLRDLNSKDRDVEKEFWIWMDRAFNKQPGGNRRYASDQHMSCSISWYWEEWALKHGVDLTKNFPWINIADFSISSHLCGMGINGMIVPEGVGFVDGKCWDKKYLDIDPRL